MTRCFSCASLVALAALTACSEQSDQSKDTKQTPVEEQWTRLVEGSWTLPPGGEEPELCIQKVVTEDTYISAIRPVHPLGTHHTLLTASDGTTGCNSSLVGNGLLYGAGVGSEGLHLPEGVAMKIPAGKTVNLGLHLYNTSTDEISGTSGIEIIRLAPEDVKFEAEAMLAGPFDISIPPGVHTQSGECTLSQEQTVFAIFPHMHQMGRHLKATFVTGGQDVVVHDGDYDFEEQYQIPLDSPMTLAPGDIIRTECTWENPTADVVTFGESSDTEMCFNIIFQYPARGVAFCGRVGSSNVTLEGPACVAETDVGNDVGVGRYCTKGGGECATTASSTFCLADYVGGEAAQFCSSQCETNADCGTGAVCSGSTRKVCFPEGCNPTFSTGSGDGGAAASGTDGGAADGG